MAEATDPGFRIALPAVLRKVEIFETLGDEERSALASLLETRRIRGGEPVFREGDPSDGLYLIQTGEVTVVSEAAGPRRVLARLGGGQIFGEMSLLTGEPRSTTVIASLDSELLFLRDAAFESLLRRYPSVALAVGRTLSQRLRRANLAARVELAERIVLCVSVTERLGAPALARSLAREIAKLRSRDVLLIEIGSSETPPRGTIRRDLTQALRRGESVRLAEHTGGPEDGVHRLAIPASGEADPRIVGPLLSLAVSQFGGTIVAGDLLDGDPAAPSAAAVRLSEEALRQCDSALLLVDDQEPSLEKARALIERDGGRPSGAAPADRWKLCLARARGPAAGAAARIEALAGRPVAHHIGPGTGGWPSDDSVARLARRLCHGAVGLALGGGGARGLAHIGILEVFESEGIPIDVVGGTSIGSIIAALHAAGHPAAALREIVRREWVERNPLNDFTLPKAALIRGRKGEKVLRRVLGEIAIEDLPRPFFAVAADLVTAEEVVIASGPLWQAVRASGSLPVLLTPVKLDGRFLVDGGIINNVPGDHLARFGAAVSIAVDVTPRRERYFEKVLARPESAGFLGRLARRSALLRDWLDYPGIVRTLRRIIAIEGMEIMKTKSAAFDVTIAPAVDGFDLLDFRRIDRLVEAGRHAAQQAIPAIRSAMAAATKRESRDAP